MVTSSGCNLTNTQYNVAIRSSGCKVKMYMIQGVKAVKQSSIVVILESGFGQDLLSA